MTKLSKTLCSDLWIAIHEVCCYLGKCEEPVFSDLGISATQCKILMDLQCKSQPPTITEIALSSHRNVNSTSAIIDRMERHNLVKRVTPKNGRRGSYVSLTRTGTRIAELAIEREGKLVQKMLGKYSVIELRSCLNIIKDMSAILTEMFNQKRQRGLSLSRRKRQTIGSKSK